MTYRNYGDLRTQVEAELDTQDETFCTYSEMQLYFNSGLTLCEAEIIKLGLREKYFQKEAFISTVQNQTDYALPADIAANKIRKVVYKNGTLVYTVNPLITERGYETEDVMSLYPPNEYYHYSLYKMGANQSYVFRITPKAFVSVTNAFRVIYWSQPQRYAGATQTIADAVLCDVPHDICYDYIMAYVRYRVYLKEGHANTQEEKSNVQILKGLMNETLQNQIADPTNDNIEADWTHYEEMA